MAFRYIVFDLDNTLYQRESGLMEEIGHRIQLWLCRELGIPWKEAADVRRQYLRQHGTTMGGLMAEHSIDVPDYLDFVHDIPVTDYLDPNPALLEMLDSLPLRKVVYTNATSAHGRRVLQALGVSEQFERIIGIEEVGLCNKFNHEAFERMLELLRASGPECVMVEDSPRNLPPAKAIGMTTILIGGDERPERVEVDEACIDFVVESVLEVERVVEEILQSAPDGTSGNGEAASNAEEN